MGIDAAGSTTKPPDPLGWQGRGGTRLVEALAGAVTSSEARRRRGARASRDRCCSSSAFSQRASSILRQDSTPTGSVPQRGRDAEREHRDARRWRPERTKGAQEHHVPSTTRGARSQKGAHPLPGRVRPEKTVPRKCRLDSNGGKKHIGRVTERNYKIDELARAAGMSARTVRYYVQRGLLPAAAFRGKDTAYGHEHLVRLRAIKRLQEGYFPLDAIAAELDGRTLAEIERLAEGKSLPASSAPASRAHAPRGDAASARRATTSYARPRERGVRRGVRRIELFPGVELTVAEDARRNPCVSSSRCWRPLKQC